MKNKGEIRTARKKGYGAPVMGTASAWLVYNTHISKLCFEKVTYYAGSSASE